MSANTPTIVTQPEVERWMGLELPSLSKITPFAPGKRAVFQGIVGDVLQGNISDLPFSRTNPVKLKLRVYAYQAAFLSLVHIALVDHLFKSETVGFTPNTFEQWQGFSGQGIKIPHKAIQKKMSGIFKAVISKTWRDNTPPALIDTRELTSGQKITMGLREDYGVPLKN